MTSPVVPGAEPFAFDGGPTGVLLLHGFTGNPSSLRPFGEWLAARGYTVSCPRYPGHGTTWRELGTVRWQDWEASAVHALEDLRGRCRDVVAVGLSMGGAMALHLGAVRASELRAVVAVNPYILDRRTRMAWLVRFFVRAVKGVGDDIKKAGVSELPYDRVPVAGVAQLAAFTKRVRAELPRVQLPVLIFRSAVDHVVPKGNVELILSKVGTREPEVVELPDSYHVATLDNDAVKIFEGTHAFIERHVPATP